MSYFKGLKLTRQGEQLLAKVNGNIGEILTFTRGELGSGEIDSEDEIYYLTALKAKWGELIITEITRTGEDETQVRIETQFTNAEWTEEKILREIGIYAKGKESSEILFAYSNAGENYDKIPIPQDNPQSFLIGITFKISTATKVDATISFSGFVTIEKLKEELAKKLNTGNLEKEVQSGEDLLNLVKGNTGTKEIKKIQDTERKIKGSIYWDNNVSPKVPYLCVNTTDDITPTSNFVAADNRSLAEHNVYEYIDFSSAHPNLNKASLEVYGKLCVLSAEILTGTANTLVMSNVIPEGYESRIQVRVGGVSRDVNPKGVSVDIQGRSIQVISYGQNSYVIYTTASWIRA